MSNINTNSTAIVWNNIAKEIKLRHPNQKTKQLILTNAIERRVYHERKATWTRILNNSSQPTIPELILISEEIGCTMDKLIESQPIIKSKASA